MLVSSCEFSSCESLYELSCLTSVQMSFHKFHIYKVFPLYVSSHEPSEMTLKHTSVHNGHTHGIQVHLTISVG